MGGAFIRGGAFIKGNTVYGPDVTTSSVTLFPMGWSFLALFG